MEQRCLSVRIICFNSAFCSLFVYRSIIQTRLSKDDCIWTIICSNDSAKQHLFCWANMDESTNVFAPMVSLTIQNFKMIDSNQSFSQTSQNNSVSTWSLSNLYRPPLWATLNRIRRLRLCVGVYHRKAESGRCMRRRRQTPLVSCTKI